MKDLWKTVSALALAAGFTTSAAYAAAPTEMITNGDFETGMFFGWTILDSGPAFRILFYLLTPLVQ